MEHEVSVVVIPFYTYVPQMYVLWFEENNVSYRYSPYIPGHYIRVLLSPEDATAFNLRFDL